MPENSIQKNSIQIVIQEGAAYSVFWGDRELGYVIEHPTPFSPFFLPPNVELEEILDCLKKLTYVDEGQLSNSGHSQIDNLTKQYSGIIKEVVSTRPSINGQYVVRITAIHTTGPLVELTYRYTPCETGLTQSGHFVLLNPDIEGSLVRELMEREEPVVLDEKPTFQVEYDPEDRDGFKKAVQSLIDQINAFHEENPDK